MKQLFTIDAKDYDPSWPKSYRPSVRGIIFNKDNLISLIYSQKYHFYKLPGGGIEEGESHLDTLIRELKEETGLTVIPDSVQEFGEALRIQKVKCIERHYFCPTKLLLYLPNFRSDSFSAP